MKQIQVLDRKVELTTRQWVLFNYLKQNKGVPKHNIDIALDVKDSNGNYFYPFDFETKNFNNTTARRDITDDVHTLIMADVIDDVIITTTDGTYIPTVEQYANWIAKEKVIQSSRFERIKKIESKARKNCQYVLVFAYENPIVEAFAKVDGAVVKEPTKLQPMPEIINVERPVNVSEVHA